MIARWSQEKPVQEGLSCADAAQILESFRAQTDAACKRRDLIMLAQKSMSMPCEDYAALDSMQLEIKDLKAVWDAVALVQSQVLAIDNTSWASFQVSARAAILIKAHPLQPRALRHALDDLSKQLLGMPNKLRMYAAYTDIQERVKERLAMHPILGELKSEIMRDRHWRQLWKELRPAKVLNLNRLSVGDVYALRLDSNKAVVRKVLDHAAGEVRQNVSNVTFP